MSSFTFAGKFVIQVAGNHQYLQSAQNGPGYQASGDSGSAAVFDKYLNDDNNLQLALYQQGNPILLKAANEIQELPAELMGLHQPGSADPKNLQRYILCAGDGGEDPALFDLVPNKNGEQTMLLSVDDLGYAFIPGPYMPKDNYWVCWATFSNYVYEDNPLYGTFLFEMVTPSPKSLIQNEGFWVDTDVSYVNLENVFTTQDNQNMLQATKNWTGSDFTGTNLRNNDLTGVNFKNARIEGADFTGAILDQVDFSGQDLTKATFSTNPSLRGAILNNANLSGMDLSAADLTGAKLQGAKLDRTYLQNADIRGADFSKCNLLNTILPEDPFSTDPDQMTKFADATISYKSLGKNWKYLDLTNATIELPENKELGNIDAQFSTLVQVNLAGCDLSNANFMNTTLGGIDLTGATLVNARFNHAHMESFQLAEQAFTNPAILTNANISGADFTGANLWGVNLQGAFQLHQRAIFNSAILILTKFDNAYLVDADLSGVMGNKMQGVSFSHACLVNANFKGTNCEAYTSADDKMVQSSFTYASLQGASFNNATLENTNMDYAILSFNSTFEQLKVTVKLDGKKVTGPNFTQTNLDGVVCYGVSCPDVSTIGDCNATANAWHTPNTVHNEWPVPPGNSGD